MSMYYTALQTTMDERKANKCAPIGKKVALSPTADWKLIGSGGYGKVYKHGNLAYKVCVDLRHEFYWTKLLGGARFAKKKRLILLDDAMQDLVQLPDKKMIGVMPYKKQTLLDMIQKRTKIDLEFAKEIFSNVTTALQYIHAHNLVHFDLSPANVLVDTDGAHVIDLGLAINIRKYKPDLAVSVSFRSVTSSICPPELLPTADEDKHMTTKELENAKYDYKNPEELTKIDIWALGVLADLIFQLALAPELTPRWFDFTSGLRENTLRYASSAVTFIKINQLQITSLLLHESPSRRIAPWLITHLT